MNLDTLDDVTTGTYEVATEHSTYVIDFDEKTVTRKRVHPGATDFGYDPGRLLSVDAAVGQSMRVYHDSRTGVIISTPVQSITEVQP